MKKNAYRPLHLYAFYFVTPSSELRARPTLSMVRSGLSSFFHPSREALAQNVNTCTIKENVCIFRLLLLLNELLCGSYFHYKMGEVHGQTNTKATF